MSGFAEARDLRERARQLVSQQEELLQLTKSEDRDFTDDDQQQWDRMHADQESLLSRARRIEEFEDDRAALNKSMGTQAGREDGAGEGGEGGSGSDDAALKELDRRALNAYLRHGFAEMDPELRAHARQRMTKLPREARALSAGTDATGGFTVPQDSSLMGAVIEARKAFGGMRRARTTVIDTDTGQDLPIPTDNDTTQQGELLSENTQGTEQDITFGQKTLEAYMYSSKIIRASFQILDDTAVNLEAYLGRKFGQRIGRITNVHFTTGDGTAKPNGVVTAATLGVTGGTTTKVTADELLDLKHSVDPDYREMAEWMFRDATLKEIKKLKDGDGRSLWSSGLAFREPDSIDGDPYIINQDVAAMAASAKAILYGAFENYYIRDVRGLTILRLVERYADFFQVGFIGFSRHDGELIDAGTNPIKYFQNAA